MSLYGYISALIIRNICLFFFNDTATTEIYTLSLHDALPIYRTVGGEPAARAVRANASPGCGEVPSSQLVAVITRTAARFSRSEEHTSELQSRQYLVCRLLLEKKKNTTRQN